MNGKKIIVAYDGSPYSEKALTLAVTLAKALFARISLISVVDSANLMGDDISDVNATRIALTRDCEDRLSVVRQQLEDQGVVATTAVLEGNPAETIIKHAQDCKASMIVAGTKGLSGFTRLLLGSTAQELVMYADIPVVIAK